ncbi:ATP-dependent RNA helicase DBP2 isoform X1 [Neltuma alba]|uniref:ATP-dependent RNA helicase DBP2 isoform X1 n=2 Tax=Neltuma alba TaxID=207710 RepID=UPI0010A3EE27|nr:ATP-dependent RNA helicase DBP2-like isoform X1 [Prosopis alba]XP_028768864.1 ATP-dependent RNA helicase DBP2-like isoform X1 [Prosopis alba]XP_028768865.1 ATP-dependent RNA helicase DBP2-like isoform X1 [Prosopis alba]XP_028768866.1 ATP-dependent RNA helicase DBP2-like isoform X1 [Prosopis alba]
MSYVPPHLRSSSSTTVAARISSLSLDTNDHSKLPNSHFHTSLTPSSSSSFSNSSRRTSGAPPLSRTLSVPDPVFPHWQPSERVSRMKPEQIEEVRLRLNLDVSVASDSLPAPAPIESFSDMCLNPSIMKDIAYHEYTRPTSIQAQAMPIALSGRDLLGCAETGSGKTAAFTIPMIEHCLAQPPIRRGDGPLALVLAPTRELAQQIEKEVKAFSRSLESLKTAIVVGGTNIEKQRSELRAGVDIVVATPGRFIDHLQQGNTSLSRISFVVLDEADRMLDMGFEPQIREVMRNLPEKHQTLLFSATMPVEIEGLAKEYLASPVQVNVGKVSSPTANVCQTLVKVSENEKIDRLLDMLVEEASQAEKCSRPFPLTIVFVERKTRCDEIAEALVAQGLSAVSLHGGRSQSERESALHDFRSGSTNILVATDVASRGLDVTGVSHVINLDLPKTMEDYVHRIGRTGRAGSTGQATSFYTDRDMFLVANIRKAIADAESGNAVAFATGKVARRKEKEAAAAQKEAKIALSKNLAFGNASIAIEDKYRFMITASNNKREGAADSAWDD